MIGPAYPAIDLSRLPSAEQYRHHGPVPLDEFERLRRPILPLLSDSSDPPAPGTEFGPLVGTARGTFGDFAWVNPWTVLTRSEILPQLQVAGVRLPTAVPTEIRFKGNSMPTLLECQLELLGLLAPVSFAPDNALPCPACGREAGRIERIVADGKSIPQHVDLFRARNAPTIILATERMAVAIQEQKLKDISITPIDTMN